MTDAHSESPLEVQRMGLEEERKGRNYGREGHGWWQQEGRGGEEKKKETGRHTGVVKQEPEEEEKGGAPGSATIGESRKVVERVHRKSKRKVQPLSSLPPHEPKAAKDKKEETQVTSVVLTVHMHCEACTKDINERIRKLKGVQVVEPDLQSSQVTVKGVFEPAKLAEDFYKRTGKRAVVIKQEPVEKKPPVEEAAEKGKEEEAKDETKAVDGGGGGGGDKEEKKEGGVDGGRGLGEEKDKKEGGSPDTAAAAAVVAAVDDYYPRYQVNYAYPPRMFSHFSDENPNACAVM